MVVALAMKASPVKQAANNSDGRRVDDGRRRITTIRISHREGSYLVGDGDGPFRKAFRSYDAALMYAAKMRATAESEGLMARIILENEITAAYIERAIKRRMAYLNRAVELGLCAIKTKDGMLVGVPVTKS